MSAPIENNANSESEVSLLDVIDFLRQSWKKLVIAAVIGAFIGFGGWVLLGQYSAEYILLNNTNTNTNTYALDIVSWKTIQKSMPNLAAQVLAEGGAPEGQDSLYKSMSEEQWWQKNISPSYAISKADTKDLAGISKDLDAASTTILSLTVTAEDATKEKSIERVRAAAKFLRTGAAYLQISNILNNYEGETISAAADIAKKITSTQIEMSYQIERAKRLEDLHKRFPGSSNVSQQVVDPKDSGAKYLPINTQIIAVNNDINQSQEMLKRMRDRLLQIALMKTFLEIASPITDKTFDGLVLGNQLLVIEGNLRGKLAKDDVNGQEILDQLHAQLLQISARFTKGLDANTAPTAKKRGMIKATAGGFFIALILMLLATLGVRVWQSIKKGGAR